ncbi:MAG: hypothetical protein ACFBRM_14630 [Pikeienuella sp.]
MTQAVSDTPAPAPGTAASIPQVPSLRVPVLLALVLLAGSWVWFVSPGVTVTAVWTGDALVMFDGMHRMDHGQIPSLDFMTPLGFLGYALPYLGMQLAGGYGGALEWASWLVCAALVGALLVLLRAGRAQPAMAALLVFAVVAMVMVPVVPGESGARVTAGMAYNRWGWAALLVLMIAGVPGHTAPRGLAWPEAVTLALLLLFLAFLKASYFAVGAAYLAGAGLLSAHLRGPAGLALGIAGLAIAGIEAATGQPSANIADLIRALEASGAVRSTFIPEIANTVWEYGLVALAMALAVVAGRARAADFLVAGFIGVSGAVLLNQNWQDRHVYVLLAAFALLARRLEDRPEGRLVPAFAAIFLAPQAINWAVASLVSLSTASAPQLSSGLPNLERFHVNSAALLELAPPGTDPDLLAGLGLSDQQVTERFHQVEFLRSVLEATELLTTHEIRDGQLFVMDFQNAITLVAGLPPMQGGYSWYHVGRTISERSKPEPDKLLGRIDHVLVPRAGPPYVDARLTRLMAESYGPYLLAHFDPLGESENWTLFTRR